MGQTLTIIELDIDGDDLVDIHVYGYGSGVDGYMEEIEESLDDGDWRKFHIVEGSLTNFPCSDYERIN